MLSGDIEAKLSGGWLPGYETNWKAPYFCLRSPDGKRERPITPAEHDAIIRRGGHASIWVDRPAD